MQHDAHAVDLEGGRRATYEAFGTGPPALMFPGGPGDSASYLRPQAEILAERFTVYMIDPHGSGGSTPPREDADYDHRGHARFYDEARVALGLERVSVYGHSFGGTVALTYAATFPEVTERCFAVAAFAIGADLDEGDAAGEMEQALARHADAAWYHEAREAMDAWTERVLAAQDPSVVDDLMRAVVPFYFAYPDRPAIRPAVEAFRRDIRMDLRAVQVWENGLYQRIDLRPLLGRIACPTLVVAGELDFVAGPAQARPIADGVRGARLTIIPECGHFPAEEAPEAFRRALAGA